uniref:Uncharacterized protein n=1 Tax=Streptomyces sp. NBC_01401 TaxID=2903854 RepID=A0AAU3GSR5_9ACTN
MSPDVELRIGRRKVVNVDLAPPGADFAPVRRAAHRCDGGR